MGFSFFKKMTEDMNSKHGLVIPELPQLEENMLMTKTTIIDTVLYENEELLEERIPH